MLRGFGNGGGGDGGSGSGGGGSGGGAAVLEADHFAVWSVGGEKNDRLS